MASANRQWPPRWVSDGLVAGTVAGVLSGVPSTVLAAWRGEPVMAAARAAGALAGRPSLRRGAMVHAGISLGWGVVLGAVACGAGRRGAPGGGPAQWRSGRSARDGPARLKGACAGACAGAALAAVDLELVGRHVRAVAALPRLGQWLDHLAYGAVAGWVLAARAQRARRLSASTERVD
jgi:hypothetical protein